MNVMTKIKRSSPQEPFLAVPMCFRVTVSEAEK